ncbi:MAG TPA: hydroxymethylbilane synthase [Steroidobacteraceae bacterium]
MRPRVLKLGTRRSVLARAQSGAVARELTALHPGITVELVGIDTRGDRIPDRALSAVEGKEFFTAEIDTALLEGAVDLSVHSYKDLSLERTARLRLAAVPRREPPQDVVVFAADVPQRLAAGCELRIGTSSPRRMSFVPDTLVRLLPRANATAPAPALRVVELRGNVDSRLRRLHEPRGAARQLDGIVLAFAGLARLWADPGGRALLEELFVPLPRMLLPLSACPAAPAQGALGIECRAADEDTVRLLAALDHAPTRRAVEAERALLAERGGGCHQRFGATQIEVSELGTLLYVREQGAEPELRWTPMLPLEAPAGPVRAWDGSRAPRAGIEPLAGGIAASLARLPHTAALFIAHERALPEAALTCIPSSTPLWVPGPATWQALAARGLWVQGCADGLGVTWLEPLLRQPLLQLPPLAQWTVLTHAQAADGWAAAQVIASYRHRLGSENSAAAAPPGDATHVYWHSSAQFERWGERVGSQAQHACGPGKTYQHLSRARVQNLRMFPSAAQWRTWLAL